MWPHLMDELSKKKKKKISILSQSERHWYNVTHFGRMSTFYQEISFKYFVHNNLQHWMFHLNAKQNAPSFMFHFNLEFLTFEKGKTNLWQIIIMTIIQHSGIWPQWPYISMSILRLNLCENSKVLSSDVMVYHTLHYVVVVLVQNNFYRNFSMCLLLASSTPNHFCILWVILC